MLVNPDFDDTHVLMRGKPSITCDCDIYNENIDCYVIASVNGGMKIDYHWSRTAYRAITDA